MQLQALAGPHYRLLLGAAWATLPFASPTLDLASWLAKVGCFLAWRTTETSFTKYKGCVLRLDRWFQPFCPESAVSKLAS